MATKSSAKEQDFGLQDRINMATVTKMSYFHRHNTYFDYFTKLELSRETSACVWLLRFIKERK